MRGEVCINVSNATVSDETEKENSKWTEHAHDPYILTIFMTYIPAPTPIYFLNRFPFIDIFLHVNHAVGIYI